MTRHRTAACSTKSPPWNGCNKTSEAFGGDPDAVTVAGGSSGAMSVITLLSMTRTRGLFHRAIAQSGAAQHVLTPATAHLVGTAMAEMLDIDLTVDAFDAVPGIN